MVLFGRPGSPENAGGKGPGFDSRHGAPVQHILLTIGDEEDYKDNEEDKDGEDENEDEDADGFEEDRGR